VVDEALTDERDRLEATVRVDGEAGHGAAVVHAPAVEAFDVVTDRPAVERCDRTEVGVARGVVVEMVDAEQERIDGRPLEPQRDGLDDGRTHTTSLAEMLANATNSYIRGKLKRSVPDPRRFNYNTKRMAVT